MALFRTRASGDGDGGGLTPQQRAALARVPSANPPASRVWKTDGDGDPGWREDETGQPDDGTSLTDSQIGDKAFSNPPSDLSVGEKTAARRAIGAGTSDFDGEYSSLSGAPDLSGIGTDATARAAAAAALPKAGGTMTGKITLDGAPTSNLHAATKKYVDDNAGDGSATGTLEARVERINFADLASGTTAAELSPTAGGISVVNGEGDAEILSGVSGNDFTVAAGVYLVNVHASYNFTVNSAVAGFAVRRASDDAELDQSNPVYPRGGTSIWSARMLVVLAADTAVNLLAKRTGNCSMSAVHAEFVRLSSGGAAHSAHNRYIGWAAQQTPSATEIAAADTFQADVLTIPAEPADGDGWLWFAVPDDAGAPDSAYFDGNTHDILGGFTRLAAATFAGHIVYATSAEQDPADLGTGDRTLTLGYD